MIYKNLIRSLILVFSLLTNHILVAQGGLTFVSNDKPKDERTSYRVFEKEINFKNNLKVSFEMTFHSPLFIGEILSIKNTRNQKEISLYYKYTYNEKNESFIQINKVGEEKIYQKKIPDEIIINGTWIDVKIILDFINDKIVFSFNGNTVEIPQNFKRNEDKYDLVFGKHDIYFDVPSFKIRNLEVVSSNVEIKFLLNQKEGVDVYSENQDYKGKVENPYWLIGDFYHWKELKTFKHTSPTEIVFDQVNSCFYMLADTYLLKYNVLINTVDSIQYSNEKNFVPSLTGKAILNNEENTIYVYKNSLNKIINNDLLIQKLGLVIEKDELAKKSLNLKNSYTVASLNLDTFIWEKISTENIFNEIRFHNNTLFNNKSNTFLMFGGYSNFNYHNDFIEYNLTTKNKSQLSFSGDVISPRFFASHVSKSENEMLVYGGVGNMSGEEYIGKKYFDDLYEVDLLNKVITRKWSGENELYQSASSENMILSSDKNYFYNLSFAENILNTNIQLKKVKIENGSTTLLGDAVPFKTNKFPNKIDLFQFEKNNQLVLYKKEYIDNKIQTNLISFYTLEFEPITLKTYDEGQAIINNNNLLKISMIIFLTIVLLIFLFIRSRSKSKDKNKYPDYLFVRSNRKNIKISLDEIWAVEALKDYIKIVCMERTHIVHTNLSMFALKLPQDKFIRIHRSFIVNTNKITSLDGDVIYLDKKYYKIGGKYIEDLKIHLNIKKV